MPSRWTSGHSSPITLQLVGPQSWTEVPALLCYDPTDPFAVRIAFGDVGDERDLVDVDEAGIAWLREPRAPAERARPPLRRGRRPACGRRTAPTDVLFLHLRAPSGEALFELSRATVAAFLRQTEALVPSVRRAPCSPSTRNCRRCCPAAGRTPRLADLRGHGRSRRGGTPRHPPAPRRRARRVEFCTQRGRGSAGRASPCQGEGRGFESRRPLGTSGAGRETGARVRWSGREARQRPAKPSTRVQIPSPPRLLRGARARRRDRSRGRTGDWRSGSALP